MKQKPQLSFWQIWNMSLGFLGIQFGFALQNANVSRILQTLGADVHELSWFWLAAPVTGFIVQPIIGYYSDKTWGRLGRRKPYFLVGAILASLALIFMPNSPALAGYIPALFIAAGMLMFMDASINVSMEPFRALVGDMLPDNQRTRGFAIQSFFIGIGAVVGSILPYVLANWLNISNSAPAGEIPMTVKLSFYIGALVFIATIIWTVLKTKEYSPTELAEFNDQEEVEKESKSGILEILSDIAKMPKTMKQLSVVQFFSWFGLFSMWVFTTPAITEHIYGASIDPESPIYNPKLYDEGANWVPILFGVYNGVAALYALILPIIAKHTSRKFTHMISLLAGGLGLASMYIINDPNVLIISMVGVGIAWASILSMPYAILTGALPAKKMGIYMGIFNFFIVIPQIVNGIFGGPLIEILFNGEAIYAMLIGGISFLIAAVTVMLVEDKEKIVLQNNEN